MKTCPRCGLINPDTSVKCDCGYILINVKPEYNKQDDLEEELLQVKRNNFVKKIILSVTLFTICTICLIILQDFDLDNLFYVLMRFIWIFSFIIILVLCYKRAVICGMFHGLGFVFLIYIIFSIIILDLSYYITFFIVLLVTCATLIASARTKRTKDANKLMSKKLALTLMIIVWGAILIEGGILFYVNHFFPVGDIYPIGEYPEDYIKESYKNNSKYDTRLVGEDHYEDMHNLNIPMWAKFHRCDGLAIIFVLLGIGCGLFFNNPYIENSRE